MPPAPHEDVGRLARCTMCGEFHFTGSVSMCGECVMAITDMRSAIESRGGSLLIVDGRIVVRTAEQRRDPSERLLEILDATRALSEMRRRG